jgi:hypothetical protein
LSAEEDLVLVVATLRRITNCHNSIVHRLPSEILAAVASHLPDNESLISATHVCHYWRSALLSCPSLWSHIEFENEEQALAFVERSKSVLVSMNIVGDSTPSEMGMEAIMAIANRLTALRGKHNSFLGGFLAQSPPFLRRLEIAKTVLPLGEQPIPTLPSVRSLVTSDVGFPLVHVPNLTNFYFTLAHGTAAPAELGDGLLDLFRSCPLLEEAFLSYGDDEGDIEFRTDEASIDAPSLPCLHSFTHEAPFGPVCIGLFNRLSLPPTCDVTFVAKTTSWLYDDSTWTDTFPAPGNPSYFFDVKMVRVMSCFPNASTPRFVFRANIHNSEGTVISFISDADSFDHPSDRPSDCGPFTKFLDFLEGFGIADTVEALHFERESAPLRYGNTPTDLTGELLKFVNLKTLVLWQCDPTIFLVNPSLPNVWCPTVRKLVICLPPLEVSAEKEVLKLVRSVAVPRQRYRIPFQNITIFTQDTERLARACRREIQELWKCVKLFRVLRFDQEGGC